MATVCEGDLRTLVVDKWTTLTDDTPVYIYCPRHEDKSRPSMRVYPDGAHCFTCGAHLNRREFSALFDERELTSAKLLADTWTHTRSTKPRVDPYTAARAAHESLMQHLEGDETWAWLEGRGLDADMARRYTLGHNGVAYTLPVFDAAGEVVTVRYRRDDAVAPHLFKFWGLKGFNGTALYPWPAQQPTTALTEGEMDALLLRKHGVAAYSFTNGARAVPSREELRRMLPATKHVLLVRDQDVPGKEGTANLIPVLSEAGIVWTTFSWDLSLGKDATALWQRHDSRFPDLVTELQLSGATL